MKFLYKIHSGYDGFRPAVIPQRMQEGRLRLGWRHYIDAVEKGWECWVYFHGPHRFENGVYVKGIVDDVDLDASVVRLRVREHSTDRPITPEEISTRIAQVVSQRYRQVFVWPHEWTVAPECGLAACKSRQCDACETWAGPTLDRAGPRDCTGAPAVVCIRSPGPGALESSRGDVTRPGSRRECRQRQAGSPISSSGKRLYAYPFARSIFEQLRRRDLLEFDYIVPIPLSPDKARNGEKHRTRALAKELGHLLAVPVREMLQLTANISKRRMLSIGHTVAEFERAYNRSLRARVPADARRICWWMTC